MIDYWTTYYASPCDACKRRTMVLFRAHPRWEGEAKGGLVCCNCRDDEDKRLEELELSGHRVEFEKYVGERLYNDTRGSFEAPAADLIHPNPYVRDLARKRYENYRNNLEFNKGADLRQRAYIKRLIEERKQELIDAGYLQDEG